MNKNLYLKAVLLLSATVTSSVHASVLDNADITISNDLASSSSLIIDHINKKMDDNSGVASGDASHPFNLWSGGTITQATQKSYNTTPEYKLLKRGISIGGHTNINKRLILGLAYSAFDNDVKSKGAFEKNDVISHTGSIYGRFAITREAFIKTQVQYGTSSIKKLQAVQIPKAPQLGEVLMSAKTDAKILAIMSKIGYNHPMTPEIIITPTIGFSNTEIKTKEFTASGSKAGFPPFNQHYDKNNIIKTSGITGITVSYLSDIWGMQFTPEIHANLDYTFNTKNHKTLVTIIEGTGTILAPSDRFARTQYNFGTSVNTIQSDMFKVSLGYDYSLARNFILHTGTLKLQVDL